MIDIKDELKIGNSYKLNIDDMDMLGRGIAHFNNSTIFVDNALRNELVQAKITTKKGKIYFADNENILVSSDFRVSPLCPYFDECGGCDLQHLKYSETLNFKKQQILIALKKIADIEVKEDFFEIISSNKEYCYRNKLALQVKNINNVATLCMFKKQSHDCVEINKCFIADEKFDIVINLVNQFFKEKQILAFNDKKNTGLIKHVVARIIDDKLLLTFVTIKNELPSVETLYQKLKNEFEAVGINININKSKKEILSSEFKHLRGIKYIAFENMNVKQVITNASFLQVNFDVQNKLYDYVLSKANGIIVNAYSGAGLLTCLLAKNKKDKIKQMKGTKNLLRYNSLIRQAEKINKIIGIELNKEATKLANTLIKANGIYNVHNICGDACVELEKLNLINYTLIVDPPRNGLSDEFIKTVLKNKPEKIIYVSCSPQTLAKNLNNLKESYLIDEIKAFDMFPQTCNVETVVILSRKK